MGGARCSDVGVECLGRACAVHRWLTLTDVSLQHTQCKIKQKQHHSRETSARYTSFGTWYFVLCFYADAMDMASTTRSHAGAIKHTRSSHSSLLFDCSLSPRRTFHKGVCWFHGRTSQDRHHETRQVEPTKTHISERWLVGRAISIYAVNRTCCVPVVVVRVAVCGFVYCINFVLCVFCFAVWFCASRRCVLVSYWCKICRTHIHTQVILCLRSTGVTQKLSATHTHTNTHTLSHTPRHRNIRPPSFILTEYITIHSLRRAPTRRNHITIAVFG